MKELLKKYKIPLIILAMIVGIVILAVIYSPKGTTQLPTFRVSPDTTGSQEPGVVPLTLVSRQPLSDQPREAVDQAEFIKFEFSAPVNVDTLKMKVNPYIKLKTKVFPENPNALWLIPDGVLWESRVKYTIIIAHLEGMAGEKLLEPVKHTYYNDPPLNVDWVGEDVFFPE